MHFEHEDRLSSCVEAVEYSVGHSSVKDGRAKVDLSQGIGLSCSSG